MLKSIVTFAVLGGSAACACAQNSAAASSVRDAGAAGNPAIFAADPGLWSDPVRHDLGRRAYDPALRGGYTAEFGALTIGRQYNLQYRALLDVADPFQGGSAGGVGNMIGTGRGVDNSIQYYGPLARGLSAGASYALREKVDTSPAGRAWGMSVGFERGPLTIRAAHQNLNAVRVQFNNKTSNDTVARNSILAANMRMGWGTAYAAYSLSRGWAASPLFNPDNPYGAGLARTPSNNSRDVLVGLAVPVSKRTTLLTSYIQKDDRDLANQDANQLAIGASHTLARRTDFYVAYSHIRNRNGAAYSVGNGNARSGNSALNVGMRHAF